jgi:chromosome segregation ATPase
LLSEVHQLRQDIEAMTVASQRVQIALFSLQMQDAAVARSAERMEAARGRCSALAGNRDHFTREIQRTEAALSTGTLGPVETKELQIHLADTKQQTETQTAEVQTCQVAETEAASQLRNDQAKLAEIEEKIERLDKTLAQSGPGPSHQ